VSPEAWSRLARCLIDAKPRVVTWHDSAWHPLPEGITDPLEVTDQVLAAALANEPLQEQPARFLVPLDPGKVIGVGLNYRRHATEVGAAIPKNPLLFAKFNTALIGHGDTIVVDEAVTKAGDWEVELAVIVGQTLRRASRSEAKQGIFGYMVANDVTARDNQFADVQWTRSKCPDTFGPLGPWIVPPTGIDPAKGRLRARVNGVLMQDDTTADMIFDIPELLSFCSWNFTLEPGDVILTGTPPGVGAFRKPPIYLRDGDRVDVEIDGIGTLTNSVVVCRLDSLVGRRPM
jgi:2-keto-4-pentenoate hydratase/2-oxohepta-3-ene-1,7-dioic acid hydratase in catechol pathway